MNNKGGFWRALFSSRGRNTRSDYWKTVGLILLAYLGVGALSAAAAVTGSALVITLVPLLSLPVLIAAAAIGVINHVKRFHDLGRSGWWVFILFAINLPIVLVAQTARDPAGKTAGALLELVFAIGVMLLLGALPGQRGPNRFGPPRNAEAVAEQFA